MKMAQLFDLSGRRALVTGGSGGIGQAMAQALGLAGAQLLLMARPHPHLHPAPPHLRLMGRRPPDLDRAAARLRAEGIAATPLAADLADAGATRQAAATALAMLGGVDILVNAAGSNLRRPFLAVTPESWATELALHLAAPFFLTQALAPGMKQRGWGRVINIASLQSYRALADSAPYGAGKGGLVQLPRAFAREWSIHGITCNAIGPGFFPTALTAAMFANAESARQNAAQTCIGRN